jgi:glycosyltransferase involved in cell wall biosynthesis
MPTHLIVIPAFNEERTIGDVVAAARHHGPVTVIDDGSTDATSARASAAGGVVVAHRHRRGKGAAIRTGAALARQMGATWMVTLDADGQHDPEAIPLLLRTARQAPGAIVIGGRLASVVGMSRARLLACLTAGFFINRLTGASVRDTQSGFRCYPVQLFEQITLRSGGFVLETEILVAGAAACWDLVEVEAAAAHQTVRPSRFHPLSDGIAIGVYLAARVLTRWAGRLRSGRATSGVGTRVQPGTRHLRPFQPSGPIESFATQPPRGEAKARRGDPSLSPAREAEGRP